VHGRRIGTRQGHHRDRHASGNRRNGANRSTTINNRGDFAASERTHAWDGFTHALGSATSDRAERFEQPISRTRPVPDRRNPPAAQGQSPSDRSRIVLCYLDPGGFGKHPNRASHDAMIIVSVAYRGSVQPQDSNSELKLTAVSRAGDPRHLIEGPRKRPHRSPPRARSNLGRHPQDQGVNPVLPEFSTGAWTRPRRRGTGATARVLFSELYGLTSVTAVSGAGPPMG
jgi:hypothetical protein